MKRASLADAERFPLGGPVLPARHVIRDNGGSRSRSLWLWVVAGFLFSALLWTALFVVARSAGIESVPLPAREGRP